MVFVRFGRSLPSSGLTSPSIDANEEVEDIVAVVQSSRRNRICKMLLAPSQGSFRSKYKISGRTQTVLKEGLVPYLGIDATFISQQHTHMLS